MTNTGRGACAFTRRQMQTRPSTDAVVRARGVATAANDAQAYWRQAWKNTSIQQSDAVLQDYVDARLYKKRNQDALVKKQQIQTLQGPAI